MQGARADLDTSERETLASEGLSAWRAQSSSEPLSREDLAKSYGVEPAELDEYLEQASQALKDSGLRPPDLESLTSAESSFYTEAAAVCGSPVAVALYPVVEGKVVALGQYSSVEPVSDTKEADHVDQAWSSPLSGGGYVVIFTTKEVPEVSVSVAVAEPACDASSVLSEVSLERGSR